MANKRMINASVVSNDLFVDMPLSAQCLYFHLLLHADDDGYISNMKYIQRGIRVSDVERDILVSNGYLERSSDGWKIKRNITGSN